MEATIYNSKTTRDRIRRAYLARLTELVGDLEDISTEKLGAIVSGLVSDCAAIVKRCELVESAIKEIEIDVAAIERPAVEPKLVPIAATEEGAS